MIPPDIPRLGKRRIGRLAGTLGAIAIVGVIAFAGFLVAPRLSHAAARVIGGGCTFIILPGHSDTKSHTYADGDTVTVHSQLYEYYEPLARQYCGQLESITTITDDGQGAPIYGFGENEIVYRLPNGQYGGEGGGPDGYSNAITLQPIIVTTTCAAPAGAFSPKDGEPGINTGAANYCPPQ